MNKPIIHKPDYGEEPIQGPKEAPILRRIKKDPNRDILNYLNNITYDTKTIDQVKHWIQTKRLPPNLNKLQIERFQTKFKYFETLDNRLYFVKDQFKLEVVSVDQVQDTLKQCYADPEMSVGLGIYKFYRQICAKYIGIKLKDVKMFLPKQEFHQLAKHSTHTINKPILVSKKNERWAIDLVDMKRYEGHNGQKRHILTCIDYFSKFAWAVPIVTKDSASVAKALDEIVKQADNVYPKLIQKDNGTEFQGEVNDWMKAHNVKYANSLSYSPESNGLIENFNKQLRKKLREMAIRTKSLRWIDHLQTAVNNKNATVNSTTKFTPNQLYNDEPYNSSIQGLVEDKIKERAKRILAKVTEFKVGDKVRIKMSAISSQLRKQIKGNRDGKYIIVGYTPEIYTIRSVLREDNPGYENKRYTCNYSNGEPLLTQAKNNFHDENRRAKRFFASDLLRVDDPPEEDHLTRTEANRLNKDDTLNEVPIPVPAPQTRTKTIIHPVNYDSDTDYQIRNYNFDEPDEPDEPVMRNPRSKRVKQAIEPATRVLRDRSKIKPASNHYR